MFGTLFKGFLNFFQSALGEIGNDLADLMGKDPDGQVASAVGSLAANVMLSDGSIDASEVQSFNKFLESDERMKSNRDAIMAAFKEAKDVGEMMPEMAWDKLKAYLDRIDEPTVKNTLGRLSQLLCRADGEIAQGERDLHAKVLATLGLRAADYPL